MRSDFPPVKTAPQTEKAEGLLGGIDNSMKAQ